MKEERTSEEGHRKRFDDSAKNKQTQKMENNNFILLMASLNKNLIIFIFLV